MSGAAQRRVVHDDLEGLHDDAAERIRQAAGSATEVRGRFLLVLTGGSTVRPIYERLADARDRIDWTAVDVFWTDERCVPPDDPESNYGLARDALLDRVPIPCERIHRMPGEEPDRDRAAMLHERRIRRALSLPAGEAPRFDFVLLGLGADAHVASLFPGHPLIGATDRLVGAVSVERFPVPAPVLDRLTLTPPALNGAREAVFVVSGEAKAQAVRSALAATRDPVRVPAHVIDPPAGTVTWLLDRAAAAAIDA